MSYHFGLWPTISDHFGANLIKALLNSIFALNLNAESRPKIKFFKIAPNRSEIVGHSLKR